MGMIVNSDRVRFRASRRITGLSVSGQVEDRRHHSCDISVSPKNLDDLDRSSDNHQRAKQFERINI